jgi:hypothetical protein
MNPNGGQSQPWDAGADQEPHNWPACRFRDRARAGSVYGSSSETASDRSGRRFRISPHRAKESNIQPNRPHQRQPIALRNNAFSELVIEEHPSILEFFLEMDIVQLPV